MTTLTLAPDPANARMRVVVQDATGGQLLRGTQPVRGGEDLTGDHLVDDYECPFGVDVTYTLDGATATGRLDVEVSWLSTATDPGLGVTVLDHDPRLYTAPGRTYHPLGDRWPIAVHTVRHQHSGDLTLVADTPDSTRLADLIADGSPLLLRTPAACAGLDDMWLFAGDVERTRRVRPDVPSWLWRFTYQRVQAPTGSVTGDPAGNAWAAVAATHATWDDLAGWHPDWFDVLLTPHPHPL